MIAKQPSLQSFVTFRNSQGEAARGTLLKLDRSAIVFEVYNPYSIVQLSEVLQEFAIRRGNEVVYKGRVTVTNLVNTGLILIVSANLTDPWPVTAPRRGNIAQLRRDAEQFITQWAEISRIREGYRIAVGELCSFLADLNRWLEQVEVSSMEPALERLKTYDGLYEFAAPILKSIEALNEKLEREARKVAESDVDTHKAFVQRQLHPLIMRAPYPHRTFNKPLGYAGDYEMMNMIHREHPEGPNIYAQLINAAYINLPIATSVRNRVRTLEQYLREGARAKAGFGETFRAISVGCGPAIEVQRFIRGSESSWKAQIDLLDFNEETLDYACEKVSKAMAESGNCAEVRYIHESVHLLLKATISQRDDNRSGKYDLVYCAGLLDYLSDKVCSRLLRLFSGWLRDGGVLLATNMHERTKNKYLLEHQAEWYLIYRNEEQMAGLVPGLGRTRTFTDETGINLCLEIRKN